MEKDLVVKSNALIQAAYSLTLSEQKIILAAITQVRRDEEITDNKLYTVTANALADMAGFKAKNEYTTLKEAAEKLWERTLTVHEEPNGAGRKVRKMRWVQEAVYLPDQGAIQLRFSKPILPYLSELSSEFTKYKLQFVAGMKSTYGVRLYEILMQWQGKGEREIELDWLRWQWELTNKYPAIKDLKKRVIDPAMKDINDHSDLWVKLGQRKSGRKVTHLQFQFGPKSEQKPTKRLTDAEIAKLALPGESWEQARERLKVVSVGR